MQVGPQIETSRLPFLSQMFGYERAPGDRIRPGFEEIRAVGPVRRPERAPMPRLQIVASEKAPVESVFVDEVEGYAHVWGVPVHPEIGRDGIPAWCGRVVAEERYECFRQLIGTFAVIVEEPLRRRITMITDVLGIRAVFVGSHMGRTVLGSDVWQLRKAGLAGDAVNYDAISSWIAYGYNCTGGSLFQGLRRLPPGAAVVLEDGRSTGIPYARFDERACAAGPEQIAEDLHDRVRATLETLLRNFPRVSLALSGGFDSRYLAALAARCVPRPEIDCGTGDGTRGGGGYPGGAGARPRSAGVSREPFRMGYPYRCLPLHGGRLSDFQIRDRLSRTTVPGDPDGERLHGRLTHERLSRPDRRKARA